MEQLRWCLRLKKNKDFRGVFCGVLVLGFLLPVLAWSARSYQKTLPHLKVDPEVEVSVSGEFPVYIHLNEGWKINDSAPSWVALFEEKSDRFENLQEFKRENVASRKLLLKGLQVGRSYRLQGVFYFCEDPQLLPKTSGKSSVCLVRSWVQRLIPVTKNGLQGLDLVVQK